MFARLALLGFLLAPAVAVAQDGPQGTTPPSPTGPVARPGGRYQLNGTYTLQQLIDFFADRFEKTILVDDPRSLSETLQFIGRSTLSYNEAYQAMLAGLEAKGFTTYDIAGVTHIVKNAESAQAPIRVGEGGDIPLTSSYITQIIALDNVAVSDVQQVVTTLASSDAKVIAYAPTNTLILTDNAHNLRKIYDVLQRLDVAAPKSTLEIVPLIHASASEVASIIEQIYGTASSGSQDRASSARTRRETAAERRRRRRREAQEADSSADGSTVGQAGSFISKVLSDERTNSLIVLANAEGHEKIRELVAELDVDVDLSSRSQIHVVYLEHAKADEVATVLSNLSQGGNQQDTPRRNPRAARSGRSGRQGGDDAGGGESDGELGGVLAAFDSGMRITSDENTNSLVIIASNDDFRIVESVIRRLDIRRKQVFVDAVILEVGSDDNLELGLGVHGGIPDAEGSGFRIGAAQLGASSIGLTQDLLSGLAVGVFGETIEVPFSTGTTTQTLSIPAFGVVLSALKSNSLVNIVSSPSLTTLDNQEAEITVGRRVPFPTTSGLNNLGQPVVSFQREDVATTLKITPRINSSDEVTLELTVEVSEIEEDDSGLDVNQAGFITSKREVSTVALVGNNETMVVGGLVGSTETEVETKIPLLGDLPLLGALFRGRRKQARRTNLLIFLTPHIIDDDEDMAEVMRIKALQRQEFLRRFYGKSVEEQTRALDELLSFSMNWPGEPSVYRPQVPSDTGDGPVEDDVDAETLEAIEEALAAPVAPGNGPVPDDGGR